MEWTTSFEPLPTKTENGGTGTAIVNRRIPAIRSNDNNDDNTRLSSPSGGPVAGSVAGPVDDSANDSAVSTAELRRAFRNKYRHVQAVHSQSKPSCLSHDTTETPSFIGFRNLMAIVLGKRQNAECPNNRDRKANVDSGLQSPSRHRKHPKG